MIGLDSVTFSGEPIDSFDSSVGPYGPANTGSAASLFSNGDVALLGGEGRAAASGRRSGRSPSRQGGARHGRRPGRHDDHEQRHDQRNGDAELAVADDRPARRARCSPFSGTQASAGTFSYNAAKGDLTVSGGKTVTLADGHVLLPRPDPLGRVEAERQRPGEDLPHGQARRERRRRLREPDVRARRTCRSRAATRAKDGVKLSGGSNAYLSVYAPRTSVELSGGSPVFGALLGKTLMISGGSIGPLRRADGDRLGAVLHALIDPGEGRRLGRRPST